MKLMNERLKRLALWWIGWGFIVLGVAGLFLPVLQGILFLLIGLSLLSTTSPWAAKVLRRVKARFPRVSGKFEVARAKARDLQANLFSKRQKRSGEAE
jgi:uncharacterized membrane protein YbaN (DUF454 family)